MALEYKVEMDMSEISAFKQLLGEIKELRDLVPGYLDHEADKHVERILELSKDCYYFKRKN